MSSYNIPLVADIHFAPTVALRVAECFDKIRVNPGNFGMNIFIDSVVFFYSLFRLCIFFNIYLKVLSCILNPKWLSFTADRRAQFEILEYTDDDYQKELEHIEQVETPVLFIFSSDDSEVYFHFYPMSVRMNDTTTAM
jgi:(E)-4-hydroxy-3-methylbut-2-enyl-diphosphate synthase